jgi:phosphatidylglycerophosphate synthase
MKMQKRYFTIDEIKKRTEKKDGSFFARYLARPVSRRITVRLYRTSISPLIITLFGSLVGIIGGLLFLLNIYWATVLAGILVALSYVFDCVDGEIARLNQKCTKTGALLDEYSDRIVDIVIILCLGLVNYWIYGFYWIWIIAFLAIAGDLTMVNIGLKIDSVREKKSVVNFYSKPLWRRALQYGGDANVLIILIFSVLNQTIYALLLIAVLTNLFSLGRIVYQYLIFKKEEKS